MTRSGDAIAMWNQSSGKYTSLWSSSRPADAQHWAARVQITNRWKSLQGRVALDLEGNATAVWSSFSTVSASFKPVGGAWQKDYLLSHWDANAMYPAVTSQSARNATAMWVDLGDQDDRVQTVSFDIDTSAKEQQGDQSADEGDDASDDGSDDGSDDEGDDGGSDEGEVFMGTGNADTLVGTPGNDVFYGRGGNDVIDGRGGNDIILGGAGNDSLRGGTGRDRIFGGPGSDRIEAGQGHDLVLGGNGVDRLAGGHGNDRLLGGAGADRLSGGRGSDVLLGGSGPDVLRGGSGDDTLVAKDRSRDRVFGGRGLDHYRLDRWRDQARSIETRY
jgi:Ca2+-binding RTX toxin-like protein